MSEFEKALDNTLVDLERILERLSKFGDGSSLGSVGVKYRSLGKALLMLDGHVREMKLEMAQARKR